MRRSSRTRKEGGRLAGLLNRNPKSREIRLRMAGALGRITNFNEAESLLASVEKEDAWDWRVLWYRGVMMLSPK